MLDASAHPVTNHFTSQTPLSNGISTNNDINQNVPTNSTSLNNLSPNHLKDNNNTINSAVGSIALIAQTTNCNHCTADDRRRQSKDGLCRKHVQCIQLPNSNSNPTNVGLNSILTKIDGSATNCGCTTNVTTSTTLTKNNSTTTNATTTQFSTTKETSNTVPKKIRHFKQFAKQNVSLFS